MKNKFRPFSLSLGKVVRYKAFTATILLLCVYWGYGSKKTKRPKSELPNIVLILADDLGYADVGFLGNDSIKTPHIDAIAESGVIFKQGYVTASICGPSRAAILTGRYQQRFGSELNPGPFKRNDSVQVGIPLSEKLISEHLKTIGYSTGVFGKWHAGGERGDTRLMPNNRGFDEFFGFLEGAALYIDSTNREKKYMRNGTQVMAEHRYFTDAIGNGAYC